MEGITSEAVIGLYKRKLSHAGGQEPFDGLLMFKAILLRQWHSLSDVALEQALCVRIDFLRFCGLSLSDATWLNIAVPGGGCTKRLCARDSHCSC